MALTVIIHVPIDIGDLDHIPSHRQKSGVMNHARVAVAKSTKNATAHNLMHLLRSVSLF